MNVGKFESSIKFSREANTHLKSDYDNLQEKFDKYMKATNSINHDLKEEIELLSNKCSRLQIIADDTEELIQAEKDKTKKELLEVNILREK